MFLCVLVFFLILQNFKYVAQAMNYVWILIPETFCGVTPSVTSQDLQTLDEVPVSTLLCSLITSASVLCCEYWRYHFEKYRPESLIKIWETTEV